MYDLKAEVVKQALKIMTSLSTLLSNDDVAPRIPLLIKTMQNPSIETLQKAIYALSQTTFVAIVTSPVLALLTPLLERSLNTSSTSQEVLRQTVVGVKDRASLPEVREMATRALQVIKTAMKDDDGNLQSGQIAPSSAEDVLKVLEKNIKLHGASLLGNSTSLAVPTANASQPPTQAPPRPHLQPLVQPQPLPPQANTSSNTSSTLTPTLSPINSTVSPSITSTSSSVSTTSTSSSVNPISQASSIISANRLTVWCTEVLGYTVPSQKTVTITSNVSAVSVVTTRPVDDNTTIRATSGSTATQLRPPPSFTVTTTPTVTDTILTTDEILVEQTTTVVGPSLGGQKRGLPYMPGKPYLYPIDNQQPRVIEPIDNVTSAASNTTSASSGTLPASSYPSPISNLTAVGSNYTARVSGYGTAVSTNATMALKATISSATGLQIVITPVILQTFSPSVINAACSQNADPPTPYPPATTSVNTTIVFTSYITSPSPTITATYFTPIENITVSNTLPNDATSTATAQAITDDATDQTTATSTLVTTVVTFPSNVPTLILSSPVGLGPSNAGGSHPPDVDDATYELILPFPMRMFDHSSESVWVSSNGILSVDNGTREYDNECLPSIGNYDYPHDSVPPYSAFPFWDDTYIYAGQPQGIYYQYGHSPASNISSSPSSSPTTSTPPTNVTFEYYLPHCCGSGDGGNEKYYHYTVFYDSLAPGIFTYRYYQISQNGTSATVGMQDFVANTAITYSCNQAIVTPELEVVLNSIIGTVVHRNFSMG